MESKKAKRIWAVSLFVIGVVTIILAGRNIMEYRLPDAVIRILGILDLAALFMMIFTAVRMKK